MYIDLFLINPEYFEISIVDGRLFGPYANNIALQDKYP